MLNYNIVNININIRINYIQVNRKFTCSSNGITNGSCTLNVRPNPVYVSVGRGGGLWESPNSILSSLYKEIYCKGGNGNGIPLPSSVTEDIIK